MNQAIPESGSKEAGQVDALEKQLKLLRELHSLLMSFAPRWYTEDMDSRLAEATDNKFES